MGVLGSSASTALTVRIVSEAGWNSVIVVQLLGTLGDQDGHDKEDNDADSGCTGKELPS